MKLLNHLTLLNFLKLPNELKEVSLYHIGMALDGEVHEVASSFFFGLEKLIPDMFATIVKNLEASKIHCPTLIYYFKRHIEVDAAEHGPKALKCLDKLTNTLEKKQRAEDVAIESLQKRKILWDFIESEIVLSKRSVAEHRIC